MATARELKNKIRSVSNTKKITRTMEMISTAKSRVCQKRIEAVQPYGDKLGEMLRDLGRAASDPEQAADFVKQTGVDALAIALGPLPVSPGRGAIGHIRGAVLWSRRAVDPMPGSGMNYRTARVRKSSSLSYRLDGFVGPLPLHGVHGVAFPARPRPPGLPRLAPLWPDSTTPCTASAS